MKDIKTIKIYQSDVDKNKYVLYFKHFIHFMNSDWNYVNPEINSREQHNNLEESKDDEKGKKVYQIILQLTLRLMTLDQKF